jgi:hypothetical protein
MRLPDAPGERLMTKNFMRVDSQALRSLDFTGRSRTLEVEFIDGEVYHYYKVPAGLWAQIREAIASGESVGAFVNQQVKGRVKELDLDYRRIITA